MTDLQKDIAKLYDAIRLLFSGDYELVALDEIIKTVEKYGITISEEGFIVRDESEAN